ncbi:GFA family protein [Parasphingorhabdus cellanae]|uniref:GFA family protein n=1 Tax=Parasphingorhabdus cellanae TaxID=2806553 RepID=A0ABX7T5C0_9SPHN|nr:GFA family protein [Parasphingorhabdus cellanae]QTD56321.1 GFA family protein [Parasphingorhabdus cellanae]
MTDTYAGGCQCGAVRYRLSGSIPPAYACHCGECKKQSASAFSMSIPLAYDALTVTGTPKVLETVAHSGKPKYNYFCGDCGTRLWHSGSNPPTAITLKVGTLDHSGDIAPVGHLWVSKKQAGIMLDPKTDQYQTQPDDVLAWRNNLGQR